MDKDNEEVTSGYAMLLAILTIPAIPLKGIVLSILWGWFIVPVFEVPAIDMLMAIGISTVVTLLVAQTNTSLPTKRVLIEISNFCYFLPIVCLVVGFIVKTFM